MPLWLIVGLVIVIGVPLMLLAWGLWVIEAGRRTGGQGHEGEGGVMGDDDMCCYGRTG